MSGRPTIRWGIIATGWISTNFTRDILLSHDDAQVTHIIAAVGTSSTEKGEAFLDSVLPTSYNHSKPKIYTEYKDVYADPDIDLIYIGTPHVFHRQNCLDAIAAGKNVVCEKPFTVTADEAEEVIAAAKAKGVFIMEAVWTRFFPLIKRLQHLLHVEKVIGDPVRMWCDFSLQMNIDNLPATSRLRDLKLGAGALLDIGIYSLTFGLLTLDPNIGSKAENPSVFSHLTVKDGIDRGDVVVFSYPSLNGRTGILTAHTDVKTPKEFCRIEGTAGTIEVHGRAAPSPREIIIKHDGKEDVVEKYDPGEFGFYYEADAAALDVLAGRKENETMPHAETLRVMKIMDGIRKDNGVRYEQDRW